MTSSTAAEHPLIRRCRQEAVLHAVSMIDRCVGVARSELEAAEKSMQSESGRAELARARVALMQHGPAWQTEFPVLLAQGMDGLLEPGAEQVPPAFDNSDISIRTLLQDAEVVRFIEAFRVRQRVVLVVQQPLGVLDSLVSSMLGLSMVRSNLNPVRPEVMCMALQRLMESTGEPEPLRHHWTRHMAAAFAEETRRLYEELIAVLRQQGVETAHYRVRLGESPDRRRQAESQIPAAASHASARDGQSAPGYGRTSHALRYGTPSARARLAATAARIPFMTQLASSAPTGATAFMREFLYRSQWIALYDEQLPAGYYKAADVELSRVTELPDPDFDAGAHALEMEQRRSQDIMARSRPSIGVDTDLSPRDWGEFASARARARILMELKVQAGRISQVLGLDAVRILVGQVAEDGRVLVPVRQLFVALEPALLRLAMNDPRFFGETSHPARVLVEQIAQRSFRYNDEYDAQLQRFLEPVRQAVHKLIRLHAITADDFESHRLSLGALWLSEDEHEQPVRQHVVLSMEFAQARQSLADRIAWEFSQRADLVGVRDAVIADFVYRQWSLVLAHAQLTKLDDNPDPGGYLAVVRDLLWSVDPELPAKHRAQLMKRVPGILKTLREGMDMLGKQPQETRAFFDALMRYHDPILRQHRKLDGGGRLRSGWSLLLGNRDHGAAEPLPHGSELPVPVEAEQPWLGEAERDVAGFEEHEHLDSSSAEASESQADERDPGGSSDVPAARVSAAQAETGTQEPSTSHPELNGHEDLSPDDLEAALRAEAARLRPGDWVDLLIRDQWRRAQLSWTSDNGSLFMFISHGGQAHSMTRRSCEKLLRKGHLRPVERDLVFERALQAVSELPIVDREEHPVRDHPASA